jgi:hypothetical protein
MTFSRRVKDGELKVYALNIKLQSRMFLEGTNSSDFAIAALGDDLQSNQLNTS